MSFVLGTYFRCHWVSDRQFIAGELWQQVIERHICLIFKFKELSNVMTQSVSKMQSTNNTDIPDSFPHLRKNKTNIYVTIFFSFGNNNHDNNNNNNNIVCFSLHF